MLKKHAILLGIIISMTLLFIATRNYPGGSQADSHSIGYDWRNNYISNLYSDQGMNGMNSSSPPWARAAMLFLCCSFILFFVDFSKKITAKTPSRIIRYCGLAGMVCAFLTVTPYHDIMVTVGGTLSLISMFYITVIILTSKLHLLKVLCILCMLTAYACNYIYYTRNYLVILPVMQKIALVLTIGWMLSLQYFTTASDFRKNK